MNPPLAIEPALIDTGRVFHHGVPAAALMMPEYRMPVFRDQVFDAA
jgi:hypothetical protein